MRTAIHVCVSALLLVACALLLIPYFKGSSGVSSLQQQTTLLGYLGKATSPTQYRGVHSNARVYLEGRNLIPMKQRIAVLLTGEVTRLHTETLASFVVAPQVLAGFDCLVFAVLKMDKRQTTPKKKRNKKDRMQERLGLRPSDSKRRRTLQRSAQDSGDYEESNESSRDYDETEEAGSSGLTDAAEQSVADQHLGGRKCPPSSRDLDLDAMRSAFAEELQSVGGELAVWDVSHEHMGNTVIVSNPDRLFSTSQSHRRNNVRMLRNMKEVAVTHVQVRDSCICSQVHGWLWCRPSYA